MHRMRIAYVRIAMFGLSALIGALPLRAEQQQVAAQSGQAGSSSSTSAREQEPSQNAPPRPASPDAQQQELDKLYEQCRRYAMQGDYTTAENQLQAGLSKSQQLNDQPRIAMFLNGLGILYDSLGQYDKAWDCHNRSLSIREVLGNQKEVALSLENLGHLNADLGQFEQALDYSTRALAIRESEGDQRAIASSLNALGIINKHLGQLDKALDCYTRALMLRSRLGDQPGIANTLDNIGNLYDALGQFNKSLDYHSRAFFIYQHLDPQQYLEDISACLDNLSNACSSLGQYGRALEYHKRALDLSVQLGKQQDIADSLYDLGEFYALTHHFKTALDYHIRALTIRKKLGNPQSIASSLTSLGIVCEQLGQYSKALEYCTQADSLLRRSDNLQDRAVGLDILGSVYADLNRLAQAKTYYENALADYERVEELVGAATEIGLFQENNQGDLYARYAELLVRMKRVPEALIQIERGRAQGLARQTAQCRADLSGFLAPPDAAQLKTDTDNFVAAESLQSAARDRLQSTSASDKQAAQTQYEQAQQHYEQAERHLAVLRADLYRRYPDYRHLRGADPPDEARLLALARAHPDTLYLEWAVLDEKTLLFALSSNAGLRTFQIPIGRKALTAQAQQWRTALIAPAETRLDQRVRALKAMAKEPHLAQSLGTVLLAPLQSAGLLAPGRFTRLVLVPDEPLLDLPFAALITADGKRLIEHYALSNSVSLGVLTWPPNPRRPSATLLCVADPMGAATSHPIQAAALRGAETPLPRAREEARQIARLVPEAQLLLGPEAREVDVKQQMGRYALLHFATHGDLNANDGLLSWLKLAAEPAGSPQSGLLEAREILEMPLSAQLAVLSACESGRGQPGGGEGLLGFAWAFQAAGCRSVVASQWQVDDAATQRLMVGFYRALRAGRSKDAALRAAMLAVKQEPGHAPPFYWAAFQLIGDSSPLKLRN